MEDLSYLHTEYARNKDIECYDIESKYDGVQRWQRDPDFFNELMWELGETIKQMKNAYSDPDMPPTFKLGRIKDRAVSINKMIEDAE
jgi:hypothetical protein